MLNNLLAIVKNPNSYIAAVISSVIGGAIGGIVGAFSAGCIRNSYVDYSKSVEQLFGFDITVFYYGFVGLVIGTIVSGAIIGAITIYKIHHKQFLPQELTDKNILTVLYYSFGISAQLTIGLTLGAMIGTLKLPGIGTAIGAGVGALILLIGVTIRQERPT